VGLTYPEAALAAVGLTYPEAVLAAVRQTFPYTAKTVVERTFQTFLSFSTKTHSENETFDAKMSRKFI
jgi:hypothetical protein